MAEKQTYQDVKENKMVPLTLLFAHSRNYRSHPPEQIKKLVASLERYGQVRSIVCQENTDSSYTIVAGHGVYLAAEKLQYQELRADILPSWWSAEQVSGYLVSDNELSKDAQDDEELLAQLLTEQQNAGYDLASLGTDEETLGQMLSSLGDEVLEEDEERTIPGLDAPDLPYKNQFAVAVMCASESEQRTIFEALTGQGYTCKVLVVNEESGKGHSKTYEGLVIPRLKKEMRILDFGAGQMDYVKKLKKQGYNIRGIEFYFRQGSLLDVGQVHKDIDVLCQDLQNRGRYDMVICDSVLNSVDSLQAEQDVLTCLSAFCKLQGMLIFSGRPRERIEYKSSETTTKTDHRRNVHFVDNDGFSAMFSEGVWRYQKFHTFQDVQRLATLHYGTSFLIYNPGTSAHERPRLAHDTLKNDGWGVVATKQKELPLEQRHASLSREFDLPLPQGKRYGRSADILAAYDAALALEQGDTCTSL